MFAYSLNNPVNRTDVGGAVSLWWYLIVDHDMGFIHRAVEAHILAKYPGTSKEYTISGFGRADIVKGSEVWEIKHAGMNPIGRIAAATAQASYYVLSDENLDRLGDAGTFSGNFVITCFDSSYNVDYKTPSAGVVLYTVTEIGTTSKQGDVVYNPKYEKDKYSVGAKITLPAVGFAGGGFAGGGKHSSIPGNTFQFI